MYRKWLAGTSLLFLLIFSSKGFAQHINLDWAKSINCSGYDYGRNIVPDKDGNVYSVGTMSSGLIDLNPGLGVDTHRVTGNSLYILKLNASGEFVWGKVITGASLGDGRSLALDAKSESLYIIGSFSNTTDFDPGPDTFNLTAPRSNAYLLKLDMSGNFIWAKNYGCVSAKGSTASYSVAVDDLGNVYTSGYFTDTADFDPGSNEHILVEESGISAYGDPYVAKFDSSGNFIWVNSIKGKGHNEEAWGLTLDSKRNVYITGRINSDTAWYETASGSAYITSFETSVFVAKLDTTGTFVWAKNFAEGGRFSIDNAYSHAIEVDRDGNAYILGRFMNSADFDPDSNAFNIMSSNGNYDVFLSKFSTDGAYVWTKTWGSRSVNTPDFGAAVTIDASGNIYTTGSFIDSCDFDPGSGTSVLTVTPYFLSSGAIRYTRSDIFISKLDSAGNYLWAKQLGGSGDDERGIGIRLDHSGNLYLTGSFRLKADFDPGEADKDTFYLSAVQGIDAFILKLSCSDTSSSFITISECADSYTFNGELYTQGGTYIQKIPNVAGCDSTITLQLNLYKIDKPVITTDSFTLGVAGSYASYQWFKNGTIIPGATDSTYTIKENGNYQVVVTSEENCSDTSDVYPVNNVSITEANNIGGQVSIYPNPAADIIYINSPVKVNINLCSVEGRIVLSESNAESISVKDLAKGIYLLNITDINGKLIKVEKVLKQ